MKCSTCGAEYSAKEIKCPYCGNPNRLGEVWQKEEETAKERRDSTKKMVVRSMPLYVANRITTVILCIAIVVAVIAFIIYAIAYKAEEISISKKQASASVAEAEELYQAGDYQALEIYLDEHRLTGTGEYSKYFQATLLYGGYENFLSDWMRFDGSSVEYIESHCNYGPVHYLLEDYAGAIQKKSYYYRDIEPENEALYESIIEEMEAVLVGELHCDESDLKTLSQIDTYGDEWDDFIKMVYMKNGWEYNKDEE